MWIKPGSLPEHGSNARHFLIETTAAGEPNDMPAYHLSLGFRTADEPGQIDLQLFTHTLKPADAQEAAPTPIAQGPFETMMDRATFESWTHVALTTDINKLTLFINGTKVIEHALPVPGPASENGGLIIGGHRAGVGRNFDGLMDEIAIWSRVLSDQEIGQLADGSHPLRQE